MSSRYLYRRVANREGDYVTHAVINTENYNSFIIY